MDECMSLMDVSMFVCMQSCCTEKFTSTLKRKYQNTPVKMCLTAGETNLKLKSYKHEVPALATSSVLNDIESQQIRAKQLLHSRTKALHTCLSCLSVTSAHVQCLPGENYAIDY